MSRKDSRPVLKTGGTGDSLAEFNQPDLAGIFCSGRGDPVLPVGLAAANDGDDFEAIAPL